MVNWMERKREFIFENLDDVDFSIISDKQEVEDITIKGPVESLSLKGLANFQNLKSLEITGCRNIAILDFRPVSSLKKLETILVENNRSLKEIVLPKSLSLKTLDLQNNELVTKRECELNREYPSHFELDEYNHPLDLNQLSESQNIELIDLSGNRIRFIDLSFIDLYPDLESIPEIILYGNLIEFLDIGAWVEKFGSYEVSRKIKITPPPSWPYSFHAYNRSGINQKYDHVPVYMTYQDGIKDFLEGYRPKFARGTLHKKWI